jgi:hypothetical protein
MLVPLIYLPLFPVNYQKIEEYGILEILIYLISVLLFSIFSHQIFIVYIYIFMQPKAEKLSMLSFFFFFDMSTQEGGFELVTSAL